MKFVCCDPFARARRRQAAASAHQEFSARREGLSSKTSLGQAARGSSFPTFDPLANAKEKARLERHQQMCDSRGSFQDKISLTWADRLSSVVPTQGSFATVLSVHEQNLQQHQSALPLIRPKWPHYLVDVWYEVLKVNKLGLRQKRHINLTQHAIVSIKGGAAPSKTYAYLDIAQIWLQNHDMAILRLRSDKQLVFVSPIAAMIVQQITTRVQVRISLEKTVYSSVVRRSSAFNPTSTSACVSTKVAATRESAVLSLHGPAVNVFTRPSDLEGFPRSSLSQAGDDSKVEESACIFPVGTLSPDSSEASSPASYETSPASTMQSPQSHSSVSVSPVYATPVPEVPPRHVVAPKGGPEVELSFSVTRRLIEAISAENDAEAQGVLQQFARSLRDRTMSRRIFPSPSPSPSPLASPDASAAQANSATPVTRSNDQSLQIENENQVDRGSHAPVLREPLPLDAVATPRLSLSTPFLRGSRVGTDSGPMRMFSIPSVAFVASPPAVPKLPNAADPSVREERAPSAAAAVAGSAGARRSERTLRLMAFEDESPEQRVQALLMRILYDDSCPEGHTRRLFIDEFCLDCSEGRARNLLEVRHFVDGLHEYLLETRGAELAAALKEPVAGNSNESASPVYGAGSASSKSAKDGSVKDQSNSSTDTESASQKTVQSNPSARSRVLSATFISIGNTFSAIATSTLSKGRSFYAGATTRSSASEASSASMSTSGKVKRNSWASEFSGRLSTEGGKDAPRSSGLTADANGPHWSHDLQDQGLDALSYLVFSAVEASVYLPLRGHILSLLPFTDPQSAVIEERTQALRHKTQQEMGVSKDCSSPLGWESAIYELTGLERAETPSMQLFALARCVKAIYAEYKQAVLPTLAAAGKDTSTCLLGADDLVPIFIYAFVQSGLKRPLLYRDLLWALGHPDLLHGECGYYLTVFESSISFVEEGLAECAVPAIVPASRGATAGNGTHNIHDGGGEGDETSADEGQSGITNPLQVDRVPPPVPPASPTLQRKRSSLPSIPGLSSLPSLPLGFRVFSEEPNVALQHNF